MLEVNIISFVLLVFIFFLLFFREKNSLSNKLLGLVFLLPGLNFIVNAFILTNLINYVPWMFFLFQITGALFAPVTYYYINSLTAHKPNKTDKVLYGFSILIVLSLLYIAVNFYLLEAQARYVYLEDMKHGPYPKALEYYSTLVFIHQLVYFTFNLIEIRRYRLRMEQQTSDLEQVKVGYLYRFTLLLWLLTFITVILYIIVEETRYVEYLNLPIVLDVVFLFILYYAFNKGAIFTVNEYHHHLELATILPVSSEKMKVRAEDERTPSQLFEQMKSAIYTNELYKNPEINIQTIANYMEKPVYLLSDTIKRSDVTFYELIRQIRVEKAKEMLLDKDCLFSVDGIGKAVGFNSRASFYRAFNKYEKESPGALKKGTNETDG